MKLLILFLVIVGAFAQTNIPAPVPPDVDTALTATMNFEGSVTQGVSDLVTTVDPLMLPIGWSLLAIFGVYALLTTLLQITMRSMTQHWYHPLASVVAYVSILFRICVAAAMLSCYLVNIPGMPFNFHNMFIYFAQALSSAITTDLLRDTLADFNLIVNSLSPVGMFAVLPALITIVLLITTVLAQLAMTLITAASYAIVGVLSICGPLMIPFYVLPGQERRFWSWFDNMLAYSMYSFVGSAFIYVFCHPYSLLSKTGQGCDMGH